MAGKMTAEFKAGRKFAEMVSSLDFRVDNFAAYLVGESLPVKNRILDLLAAFVIGHSSAWNEKRVDMTNAAEVDFYVRNEQMRDALKAFGY